MDSNNMNTGMEPQVNATTYQEPTPEVQVQAQPQVQAVQPKKKGKGGLVAVIIVVVVLVLALLIGVVVVAASLLGSPERKVEKGLANLAEELTASQNPVFEKLEMKEYLEQVNTVGSTEEFSLNISDIEDMDMTIGVDMVSSFDFENKKLSMDAAVSVMNITLATLEMASDEENMYIAIPEFFGDTIKLPVEGFAEKFNDSELAYYIGMELPEDMDISLFPEEGEPEEVEEMFSEDFIETIEEHKAAIADSMTIEKYDDTKEVTVGDNEVECKGYIITVGEDEINDLYESIFEEIVYGDASDYFVEALHEEYSMNGYTEEDTREEWEYMMGSAGLEIKDDLEIILYMDKKNRIVSMEIEELSMVLIDEYYEEEVIFGLVIDLIGEERTIDEIEAELTIESDMDNTIVCSLTRVAEGDENQLTDEWCVELIGDLDYDEYVLIEMISEWNADDMEAYLDLRLQSGQEYTEEIEVELEGSVEEYEVGKSYTFEIDNMTMYVDYEPVITISGEWTTSMLEDEIEMPTDAWEILDATSTEIEDWVWEIYDNMSNMDMGF